ncbi:hypothetical protein B1759_03805 [Rubrivirga sp. SAORIC476]|uniref:hypothetical protein n=1 Tax=Rubrivirga sp. SAORIC476 TaxID=1961794 RepID=UPI000BA93F5D|nr:hypothetical protein [Rubrivirga sp. SAORIC476]MAQ93985.1 hypothetical protein [Rhodothermaceae bacterium]MBC12103.1 hypothetical protein [Rhodothermaceae bacterium]PAP80518.1 hypothetical protein B1759_03805 [Rubrivirga sp. SAORIC476]
MPERRGMIIKNVSERPLDLRLDTRTLHLEAGEERPVSPVEVKDTRLRQALQVRSIAIVRPTTPEESEALAEELSNE